jgi:Tfp pilus assembly protein FimT
MKERNCPIKSSRQFRGLAGFSTVDLAAGVVVASILLAFALPPVANAAKSYNLSGAARAIAAQATVARMRASADFTQARLNVNVAAGTYAVEVCTVKNLATGGCTTFTTEGGTQTLPTGITFGYGSISVAAGTQSSIGETCPFLFNSRGIPIDPSSLTPTGDNAVYLHNTAGQYYAVTVSASGRTAVWRYSQSTWKRA